MPKLNHEMSMTLSEEKRKLYERLHEWMYQESLRTNHTPLPKELKEPVEWEAFCKWRNDNWRKLGRAFGENLDRWLAAKPAQEPSPALALAEEPPPYRSKK